MTNLNINLLQTIDFRFTIERMPKVNFFVQSAILPGITSGNITHPTPFRNVPRPGTKLNYSPLILTCKIDSKLESYLEVWNWLRGIAGDSDFEEYKATLENRGIFSDATLSILDAQSNPLIEINYQDLFPTDISEIIVDTTQSDVEYPVVNMSFMYNKYDIKILT